MGESWKDSVNRKRAELADQLHEPMAQLAARCSAVWGDRQKLNELLIAAFGEIPHVKYLYALDSKGVQVCDNIAVDGLLTRHFGRDRAQRPYLQEPMPPWGFLLSDAYVSLSGRPSLTALHEVRDGDTVLGSVGADFDLRYLPAVETPHAEPRAWSQLKGDPSIRGTVFQQQRVDSTMDQNIDRALSILEDLMIERGMFQVVIHFSSSRATAWFLDDPYRYRLIDHEALADPDVCLLYPRQPWPTDATMRPDAVKPILKAMRELRLTDQHIYLRSASINIFNGMVSLTFSCDGSHYLSCDDFLDRNSDFWLGVGG
ncbi:MAG: PDC sensor domain-containing protein [Rhodocyclaceae bacterium]|nr:PDC sensor domain-containing protein [Rhodocyclaceae bacterium]